MLAVIELLANTPADLEMKIRCHRHIARIKQAVDIAPQQQPVACFVFAGRNDLERRVIINSVGPVWEGNQVWLILGGGAIFAAWPQLYAVSFSGFYIAMFAILVALILRPVAFKFRGKRDEPAWRARWDWALFIGGFVPSLIFGVAMGNVLQGVPFR